jgi:hypothetical protein
VPVETSALGLILGWVALGQHLARAKDRVTVPGPVQMAVHILHRVTGRARALGMVTALALPMELGMRAQRLVVVRARRRVRAQGLVWARGLWA